MNISEWQESVDQWIKEYGVRYFSELTNSVLLSEEVGELSRLMARKYGEQSFKKNTTEEEVKEQISEEIADIFFVLTCLSNQMDIDISCVLERNMKKKTLRDSNRHKDNPKL